MTENLPVQIYPNKIKSRIVFKIKTSYLKLLASGKKDVDKDKDGENQNRLTYFRFIVIQSKTIINTSKVLFTFLPNKQSGQLISISPHSLTMMNTVNTEFSSAEVWFTDQAIKALEIEDNVNLTLVTGQSL